MSGAFERLLARHGEDFTLQTYSQGSLDAYRDSARTAGTPSTLRALRVNTSERGRETRNVSGTERLDALDLLVLIDEVLPDADGSEFAPEVTDAAGTTYRILNVSLVGAPLGAKRLMCRRNFDA
jgi:hypothetical protein